MNRFEARLGKWVVRRRWWIIIATILAVSVAASGMRFLTVTNDTRVFFSEQNPQLQALEALEDTYTKEQNVFFAVALPFLAAYVRTKVWWTLVPAGIMLIMGIAFLIAEGSAQIAAAAAMIVVGLIILARGFLRREPVTPSE